MIKSIPATELATGMVLALPAGRTATVQFPPAIGTWYVTFATEYGKSRVGRYDEVLIEEADDDKTPTRTIEMTLDDGTVAVWYNVSDSTAEAIEKILGAPDGMAT